MRSKLGENSKGTERGRRLAEALKANIGRRKAQARERQRLAGNTSPAKDMLEDVPAKPEKETP
jgi:hypothetical protein